MSKTEFGMFDMPVS